MPLRLRRVRGLTLVELLLAITYLGLCASSILGCITAAAQKMKEIEQREAVLSYLTSQMEALTATARRPGATTLSNSINVTIAGVLKQVNVVRKIESVGGYPDLFYIEVTATWTVSSTRANRTQTLKLSNYARSPYG